MLIDEELFTTPVELSAGAMVVSGILQMILYQRAWAEALQSSFRPTRRDQRHRRPRWRKLVARKAISQRFRELFDRLDSCDPGRAE